jgi:hypothetical protein
LALFLHAADVLCLTSNYPELHIPASRHISQHIAGLSTSGTGESRRLDAGFAYHMSAAHRDTQIGIFAEHLPTPRRSRVRTSRPMARNWDAG